VSSRVREIELTRIRHDLIPYMPDALEIYVPVKARTSAGAQTLTYPSTPTQVVPGSLGPMGAEDTAYYADKLGSRMGWVATVPYGIAIGNDNRLKVGSRQFEVIGTDSPRSFQMDVRIMLRELL